MTTPRGVHPQHVPQREEDMDVEGGGQSIADLQQDAAAKLRAYENSSRGKGGAAISQHGAC